jgi:hypothetical protein
MPGTTDQRLFYSIEPTNRTDTDGRYLLVTHKDTIKAASTYIDQVLASLSNHSPDNMQRIMRDGKPVARANRVPTSARFQSYAHTLQSMIPASITTTHPPPNAWKRHPPAIMDLTTDHFPPLDAVKKPRTDTHISNGSAATEGTESLTLIDLDEIEKAQQQMKSDLQSEITHLRQASEEMQKKLQADFHNAMQQLELRVTQTTSQMIQDLGNSLQQAVLTLNAQAERSEQTINQFHTAMELNSQQLLQAVSAQIASLAQPPTSPDRPRKHTKEITPHRTPGTHTHTHPDTNMTDSSADRSHNPPARQASLPMHGTSPLAGTSK